MIVRPVCLEDSPELLGKTNGKGLSSVKKAIYEGCSKFFHLENAIFAKKIFLSPNFRELHVYLSRYMLAKIFKKNMDV